MKIVIIGNRNKPLTFNVVSGIMNNKKYNIELVVLKKPKPKPKNDISKLTIGFRSLVSKVYHKIKEFIIPVNNNVKELCVSNNINYFETFDLNDTGVSQLISNIHPDVIILAGSSIIKEHIFTLSKLYTINIHRSLLPKYAGLQAIFWALYHDESEIGATVHTVNKGIDTGDIIVQRKKIVTKKDDVETLTNWYYQIAPELIIEALEIISSYRNVNFIKQDKSQRSYFSRPTEEQKKELYLKLKNRK